MIYSADGETPTSVSATAINVANKRFPMLGRQYTMVAQRVALVQLANGTKVKNRVKLNEFNFAPSQSASNDGDQVNQSVRVQMTDAAGDRKKFYYMGGIPDAINVGGGVLDQSKIGWGALFAAWAASLAPVPGKTWGYIGDTPFLQAGVTGYAIGAGGLVTITVDGNIFVTPGTGFAKQIVRAKGINVKSPLNKALLVQPLTATTMRTIKPIGVGPYTTGGTVTSYTYPFVGINLVEADGISEHKRGRPLNASRGRAPVQTRY